MAVRKDFIAGPATEVGKPNTNDPYIMGRREVLSDDPKEPINVTVWQKPENGKHKTNFIVDIEEVGKGELKGEWVDPDGEHHDKGEKVDGFLYTRVGTADTMDQALDLMEGKLERSLREEDADQAIAEVEEAIADAETTPTPAEAEMPEGELALVVPETAETVRQGKKKKHRR